MVIPVAPNVSLAPRVAAVAPNGRAKAHQTGRVPIASQEAAAGIGESSWRQRAELEAIGTLVRSHLGYARTVADFRESGRVTGSVRDGGDLDRRQPRFAGRRPHAAIVDGADDTVPAVDPDPGARIAVVVGPAKG